MTPTDPDTPDGSAGLKSGQTPRRRRKQGGRVPQVDPNCRNRQRADTVWTKRQFIALCRHLMNSNPPSDFLLVYHDNTGRPRFARAKTAKFGQRCDWSWNSITGRARERTGIGFYPSDPDSQTCWGAIDFDAHDGNAERARRWAFAALDFLQQLRPDLYFILTTSGSEGWHLFAIAEYLRSIESWTLLLKQVVAGIGAQLESGLCEIFPDELRSGSLPRGIRAPGTWNPKTDQVGLIAFSSVEGLSSEIERRKEESPFLYHSSHPGKTLHLNDRKTFYSGGKADWQRQFAVLHRGTRHQRLTELVAAAFRQAGHDVVRRNAEMQFLASRVAMNATLADHLQEFEESWDWMEKQWWAELPDAEKSCFETLPLTIERELFRLLLNFAQYAPTQGRPDFPFSIQSVGDRLGKSPQHISNLRRRFATNGLITETSPAAPTAQRPAIDGGPRSSGSELHYRGRTTELHPHSWCQSEVLKHR